MTQIPLKFYKVTALPVTCDTDAFYYIDHGGFSTGYITDSAGVPKKIMADGNIQIPTLQVTKSNMNKIPPRGLVYVGGTKNFIVTQDRMRSLWDVNTDHASTFSTPAGSISYGPNELYQKMHNVFFNMFYNPQISEGWRLLNPRIFLFRRINRKSRQRNGFKSYKSFLGYTHPPTILADRSVTDVHFYNGIPWEDEDFKQVYTNCRPDSLLFGKTEFPFNQDPYTEFNIEVNLKNWFKPRIHHRDGRFTNWAQDARFEFPFKKDTGSGDDYKGPFGGTQKSPGIMFKFAIAIDNPFYQIPSHPLGKYPLLFGELSNPVGVKLQSKEGVYFGHKIIIK